MIEVLLNNLKSDYFKANKLSGEDKKRIFREVKLLLTAQTDKLSKLISEEIRFNRSDSTKEVERAIKTFSIAESHANYRVESKYQIDGKIVIERRIARGPLLAITPFSSPLSSPAHKIAMGLLAGTSVLFKPSRLAIQTGKALYDVISRATRGKLVYFLDKYDNLNQVVADSRIGIISFTGGYETGSMIIKNAGVKKYHMELSGGNSMIIFSPSYQDYNSELIKNIVQGVTSKNGQRCVSIKHLVLPYKQKGFLDDLINKLNLTIDPITSKDSRLGPLVTVQYARKTEGKVLAMLNSNKDIKPILRFRRRGALIYPSVFLNYPVVCSKIKDLLFYDLPGPVIFIHPYRNFKEYTQMLTEVKQDYIRSGLQISIFTKKPEQELIKDIYWGGIIINDITTYRNDYMSFGGFGMAGLGKEGFFETYNIYTDPQVIVTNKSENLSMYRRLKESSKTK